MTEATRRQSAPGPAMIDQAEARAASDALYSVIMGLLEEGLDRGASAPRGDDPCIARGEIFRALAADLATLAEAAALLGRFADRSP
ncbi:hypothetical protein DSM104635_03397 [Terricaulis silvestris]|uniref:Uncharacterized protein n=2 Tax=Terricaulis silvestris TaxID=2686094 RepID=A0A6I6MUV3_9CAUL|nr:hypothetical protein DSM104635_03397 [Terricaulis silvestris]